jgi:hypothetical protein
MRKVKNLILLLAALPGCALAQEAPVSPPRATNFPALANYPDPACARPGEQPKRPNATSVVEVDRYNALLATYNKRAHDYVTCINVYVRNADADMDLIRRKSRDAVDAANR